MSISGDYALPELIKKFEALSDGRILLDLSANLGETAVDLVKDGFARQSDPYHAPWAPLKKRQGMILQDTARLKNSFFALPPRPDRFGFFTNVRYAVFHQKGTIRIPRRMMGPDGAVPPPWAAAFLKTADEILQDLFRQ